MSDEVEADRRATRSRQTIAMRPIRGIHRNVSTTAVPSGAFTDAQGYMPSELGLVRRFSFQTPGITFPDIIRWDYLDSFINDDGTKVTFGIGDGKFYELAGTGFIERPNHYPNINSTHPAGKLVVTVGSNIVAGDAGSDFLTDAGLIQGDKIHVLSSGEILTVDVVLSDTEIRVFEYPLTAAAASDYYIERLMYPAVEWAIKVVRLDRYLYICTGDNTIMIYDIDNPSYISTWWEKSRELGIIGTDPGQFPEPVDPNFFPKAIEVFKDRIWIGNIKSELNDKLYSSRVSWTPIFAPTYFLPESQYVDLVAVAGEIGSLNMLGNFLMVYFEFGVQFGRETAIPGDVFPLAFDVIETGKRGALQPNAVSSGVSGNFFVSTDNVYFIGSDLNTQSISDAVSEMMFSEDKIKTAYKLISLSEAEGLVVGASTYEGAFEELWVFNYTTKEWTRIEISADFIASFAIGSRQVYSDFPEGQIYSGATDEHGGPCNDGVWDTTRAASAPYYFTNYDTQVDDMSNGLAKDDPIGGTLTPGTTFVPIYGVINSLGDNESRYAELSDFTICDLTYGFTTGIVSSNKFFITTGKFIHVYDKVQPLDYDGSPANALIETGDLDLGIPDTYKTFYKVAMRLHNQAPDRIEYRLYSSDDSGITWYAMGRLVINAGGKEGRCNFIHTGSASRFRLVSVSPVSYYIITEITFDVRLRGRQFGDF